MNTSIQEGLVGLQAGYTPGYSLTDALTAQVPILTGDGLGAVGGWAADFASSEEGYFGSAAGYTGLGTWGKAGLSTAIGLPQLAL